MTELDDVRNDVYEKVGGEQRDMDLLSTSDEFPGFGDGESSGTRDMIDSALEEGFSPPLERDQNGDDDE